ncbi:BspA family leucine-rich repeat surface protein [Winogradskyella sp.]|uniref:BspA family leucine-rich repeat surface protein n=1 Tax=Winogradskyella sp. TaxID=1883156 RepID=UPI003BAB074D
MKLSINSLIIVCCLFFGLQRTHAQCDDTSDIIQNDTDYDPLEMQGTMTLNNATLSPITETDAFGLVPILLIDNDGTDPVIGTFNNLPEGTGIVFGDFESMISYVGGDGNDVVLRPDGVDPVAICQNIAVPVGLNGVTVTGDQIDGGSTDDVGIAEFLINGEPSVAFTYEDLGDNPVTLTVVDAMGNTAECTATVTLTIDETESFTTQWETTSNNETISIPTAGTGYNYVVDWGDGTIATGITGNATHSYATADTYTVRVLGDFPHIYFNNGGNRLKLVEIQQWGAIAWDSMESAFRGCENLIISATDAPDLSNVTNMERMFQAAGNNIDINLWADISHWDVSHVENMSSLFRESNFNQDISSWTVDSVSDMKRMFQANSQFNQNISSWNVGNVTTMYGMFFGASSFDQDLSIWDVSQVQIMRDMFRNATSFDQDLGAWDISSLRSTTMLGMLSNVALSTENYDRTLIGWATLDAGETQIPTGVTFDGGNSQYCLGEAARNTLTDPTGFNWAITDGGSNCTDAFITTWEITSANENILIGTGTYYAVDWGDGTIEFGVTDEATHEYGLPGTYTVSIIGDFTRLLIHGKSNDMLEIQEVQQWGTSVWDSFASAFRGCVNLDITATDIPNLSNVTDLRKMFIYCTSLTGNESFNLWDVSNVEGMESMFLGASNFNQPLDLWNVGNVTSMLEMFSGATSFNQDLSGWDVSNVSDMRWMFDGATDFDQDLGSWDISSLAMADGMFLNAGLSTENYDNTLIAWATLDAGAGETQIPSSITFDGGSSHYCLSQTQRQELMDTYGWTISDGGKSPVCFDSDSFVTVWETTSDNESITIPTTGSGYSYNISWGDGTIDTGFTGDAIHQYATAGTYTVSIVGDFPRIYFNNGGDRFKIRGVTQWGSTAWTSMESAFTGCEHLDITATDLPDLSQVTNAYNMLAFCVGLVGDSSFNAWDVSNVETMQGMFAGATNFNQDISNWNVSYVESMNEMFSEATNFNQDLSSWDVSNVDDMRWMFEGAQSFNQPLSNWNVGNVTSMREMFSGATSFNQDLSGWDVGNVVDMMRMFDGATDFDQDLGSWDISSLAEADGMFINAGLSTENYDNTLIAWATLDAVAGETQIPSSITFDGGNSHYCLSQTQRQELIDTYGWTISDGGKSSICFDSDSFVTAWETTSDNESITIPTTGSGYSYNVSWGDGTIDTGFTGDAIHQYATAGTYTVSIVGNFPRIYFNNGGDRLKIQEVTQWGSTAWTSMASAFRGCEHLDITATDLPDLSQVTNAYNMLAFCVGLVGDSSFNAWDVSNVETMQGMFAGATNFNQDISNWNVSYVESMNEMFSEATNFNQDLSSWDVSNVDDMRWMFEGAQSFNQPLSNWNVGNVTSMREMFSGATSFNQPLNNWDVGNVGDMRWMFDGAIGFDQDLGSWDISSLTEADGMFINAGLSTENYDNTLIAWATLDAVAGETQIPSSITFDGGSSQYCLSQTQRQELMDTYGWNISDGGKPSVCFNSDSFVTVWETTSDNESITIPTTGSGYSYNVSWGDGTIDTGFTGDATHQYATAGTYTVSIVGNFPRIYFNNGGDRLKIREVTQWGSIAWASMASAFMGCEHLDITATDLPDLSQVTNVYNMLASCVGLVGNSSFNAWDVTNVETMQGMFAGATNFNQPLNNWDVGNVSDMRWMFDGTLSFDQDLGSWDISSLAEADGMFLNAGLSTENYDNTLIGWVTLDAGAGETQIPSSITFDGGNSHYCLSQTQRQELIDTYGWTISDGGKLSVCFNSDSFVTVWETTSDNESITIPTTGSGYNYNVSWGDGTIDTGFTGDATHQYATAGTYTVSIVGDFPRIYFNNDGDRFKIREITQWGSIAWASMESAFKGCGEMDITATDVPDLSQVTNAYNMLTSCVSLVGNSSFNAWDVSNVETMEVMFAGAINFNQDISNWNVTAVESMAYMFIGASLFNQDLSGWDVGNVLYMNWMFSDAISFNQDLSGWDVGNVIDMGWMFDDATSFNQDLSGWDVSNVSDMAWMFYNATDFDQNLGRWDISSLTRADGMFSNAGLSTENYDSTLVGWATLDASETQVPSGITFNGGNSHYCLSQTQRQELIDTYGWSITDGGIDADCPNDSDAFVTEWVTSTDNESITVPTNAIYTYNYDIDWGDGHIDWNVNGDATHSYTTAGTYRVRIFGEFPAIYFNDAVSPPAENSLRIRSVEQWGTIQWQSMANAFTGCRFMDVTATDIPDLSQVISMNSMFFHCKSLIGDASINNWDVTNVIDMSWMFAGTTPFNQPLSNWNVSNVSNMEYMFLNDTNFNQPLNAWNVSNVSNMAYMFSRAVFNQPLNNWDVSNVSTMERMFDRSVNFDQDLGDWDISSLTNAEDMFFNTGLSTANYDSTLIGWNNDSSGLPNDGIDDIPSGITFKGGNSNYCLSQTQRQELIDSYGWSITDGGLDSSCPTDIFVAPKVYLQGAAVNPNAGEETLMRDDFRVTNTSEVMISPYGDAAAPDDLPGFFSYSGPGAFVDWVWVELRDKDDPSVVIAGQSGMLTRNGNIVDPMDISLAVPLNFYVPADAYYVVVNHRNHVGIMSSTAVSLSGTVTEVDLSSDPSMVEGGSSSVVLLANGSYGMYTGDYDANAQIQNTDAYVVVQLIGGAGYEDADMDLNTQIQNTDVNVLISPNIGRGEQFGRPSVPTEQLSTDVTLAFADAQITNDGVDDYYEADIVISGTTDFYVGSGQVYLDYATAAFGENISANGNIEYSQPDGSILGYSFGAFSPAYRDFIENDNIVSRVSLSFQQNVGLTGLETAPELQITSTPKVLFHIKIRYTDVSEDAGMCFYSDGIFQDQFFTACGGAATADCTNTPGVQITDDTYDCSEAGVGTLSIASFETDQILLYPNPVGTSFRIKGLGTMSQIRIYDVSGRLIVEQPRNDESPIDMRAYRDGVYLVKITSGSATVIKQLIKKSE